MASREKAPRKKRGIESYEHKDKKRSNNPPVGLVTPQTDPDPDTWKSYAFDPHRDPQLVWAGKAERTSFEVPTVSLHVHERIEPRTILEAVRKRNGDGSAFQGFLFDAPGRTCRCATPWTSTSILEIEPLAGIGRGERTRK